MMGDKVDYYGAWDLNHVTWLCRFVLGGNMGKGHVDLLFGLLVAPCHIL
jgi:hypothetical protein